MRPFSEEVSVHSISISTASASGNINHYNISLHKMRLVELIDYYFILNCLINLCYKTTSKFSSTGTIELLR